METVIMTKICSDKYEFPHQIMLYKTLNGSRINYTLKVLINKRFFNIKLPFHTMKTISSLTIVKSTVPKSFIDYDVRDLVSGDRYSYLKLIDLYTENDYRGLHLTTHFIKNVIKDLEETEKYPVIYTYAGASTKEYPKELTDDECSKIAEDISKFYKKLGFVDVNSFSNFECGRSMIYLNNTVSNDLCKKFISLYSDLRYNYSIQKSWIDEVCKRYYDA